MNSSQQSITATTISAEPATITTAQLAWLALVLTPGMGATRTWRALHRLGDPAHLFDLSLTELEGLGLPSNSAQFVADGRAKAAALDEFQRTSEAGGRILTPVDDAYPERLREIYDPPAVCGFAAMWSSVRGPASRSWARATHRPTAPAWRRCSRAILPLAA